MVTTSTGVVNMAPEEVDIEQRQTLWVGGLNEKVSEEILYELFQNVSFEVKYREARKRTAFISKDLGYSFNSLQHLYR